MLSKSANLKAFFDFSNRLRTKRFNSLRTLCGKTTQIRESLATANTMASIFMSIAVFVTFADIKKLAKESKTAGANLKF